MTPIDEFELRRELMQADPGHGSASLGPAVIKRGQTIKRNRAIVGAVAALALVAGGGFGIAQPLPDSGRHAVPAQTVSPTPTASPSPTSAPEPTVAPTPTTTDSALPNPTPVVDPSATAGSADPVEAPIWTNPAVIPGQVGEAGSITLLNDDTAPRRGVPVGAPPARLDRLRGAQALRPSVVAGAQGHRMIEATGPESFQAEGFMVFRSEDAATRFMNQYRAQAKTSSTTSRRS